MKAPSTKTIVLALLSGALLCAAIAWGIWTGTRNTRAAPVASPSSSELEQLSREITALTEAQAALVGRISHVETAQASADTRRSESSPAKQELQQTAEAGPSDDLTSADSLEVKYGPEDLENDLDLLCEPSTPWDEKERIWGDIRKSGLIDDALGAFEARARANPQDADCQADLGYAYLQKIDTVSEFERGKWATKADGAFDAALAVDENHWFARFSKATALSFWPPIMGRQEEAIRHFEILREQQEARAPAGHFARTYEFLGNLYQNKGELAKAQEVWKKGAELFPEDTNLGKKLRGSS